MGDLFPGSFWKKPKRGHFVLPEKGNPLKRAVGGISEGTESPEAKGRVREAVESLHIPSPWEKPNILPAWSEPEATGSICCALMRHTPKKPDYSPSILSSDRCPAEGV